MCLWTVAWLLWDLGRLTAKETHTRGFSLNSKTLMYIMLLEKHLQGNKWNQKEFSFRNLV